MKDTKVIVYCDICDKPREVNRSYVTRWKKLESNPLCVSCAQTIVREKKRNEVKKPTIKDIGTKAPCGNYIIETEKGRCPGYLKCQTSEFCRAHAGIRNWKGFTCEKG